MFARSVVVAFPLPCRSFKPQYRFLSQSPNFQAVADKPTTMSSSGSESNEIAEKPVYATKVNYDRAKIQQRYQNAEAGAGQIPTKWQRRFLVITKLYQSQADIPEVVANGTMNRMHDRMRVVFIIVASVVFFTIFFIVERVNAHRIARDRDLGVVVTKM